MVGGPPPGLLVQLVRGRRGPVGLQGRARAGLVLGGEAASFEVGHGGADDGRGHFEAGGELPQGGRPVPAELGQDGGTGRGQLRLADPGAGFANQPRLQRLHRPGEVHQGVDELVVAHGRARLPASCRAPTSSARRPSAAGITSIAAAVGRLGEPVHRGADAVDQGRPGSPELAADDQRRRVEQVAQVGEDLAEGPAGLVQDPGGDRVVERGRADLRRVEVRMGVGDLLPDRLHRDHRLQAPAVAAAAQLRTSGEGGVADLPGEPGRALVGLALDHQPGADPV